MIDSSIPLQVRPAQVDSPTQALQRQISIADAISGMNERQQLSKERAVTTDLNKLRLADAQKQQADENALSGAMDKHWKFNAETGESSMDDAGVLAELPGHLHSVYEERKSDFLTKRNKQLVDELEGAHKITEALGVPASNFLAIPEEKRAAEYPSLVRSLAQADPSLATKLPPIYGPEASAKIQELVDHREQIRKIADKVKEAQDKEKLEQLADDQLTAEARWTKYNPDAGPMPLWYKNAINAKKAGVTAPPASAYVDKKITQINGNNIPEDAIDRDGTAVPTSQRSADTIFEQRQDSNGKIYYQVTKGAAKTSKEKEHERIEKAYALTIGKKYEDLNDKERVNADAWYAKMTPQKATEFDKRLSLYEKNPDTYAALYGHGGANADKPVTAAQKASILGRINTEITRQGLTGKEATDFKNDRLAELKEAGIDMAAAPVTPKKPTTSFMDKPVKGMLQPGNVEIYNRPVLKNSNGSTSTTVSTSFNIDGKEVLLPTVVDGKRLTDKEAIDRYIKTGEHLGKFDTVANAEAYANALHNAQTDHAGLPRGNAPIDNYGPEQDMKVKSTGATVRVHKNLKTGKWESVAPSK